MTLSRCDNCDHTCDEQDLDDIEGFHERLDDGGVAPTGQCPDGGALSYVVEEA